jgi:peroxiredoxin
MGTSHRYLLGKKRKEPAMSLAVGTAAPAFELLDQNRNTVSLDSLKGRKTLVVFIPFPFTGICDGEACELRDRMAALNEFDVNVVVITAHAVPVTIKWAVDNGFEFPVLSDYWPHGAVAQAYDVFNADRGVAYRATFLLDVDGVVIDVIETDSLGTPREFEAYRAALRA